MLYIQFLKVIVSDDRYLLRSIFTWRNLKKLMSCVCLLCKISCLTLLTLFPLSFNLMQPIVAVPSFIFADSFNKFLPFCTGFAAGCMIWMVIAEVLPDAFKVSSLDVFSLIC